MIKRISEAKRIELRKQKEYRVKLDILIKILIEKGAILENEISMETSSN